MKPERIELSEKEKKARAARNLAIALALGAFAILLYVATWAKLGANVLNRSL